MDGDGPAFLYLAAAALYMLLVTAHATRDLSLRWKLAAALGWGTIIVVLALVVSQMGWGHF